MTDLYVEPPTYAIWFQNEKKFYWDINTDSRRRVFTTQKYWEARAVQFQLNYGEVVEVSAFLKSQGEPKVPWDRDIIAELDANPGPYGHTTLDAQHGWWKRTLDQIDALTFHHTLSNSPHATATYIALQKSNGQGIGHPTTEYTIWITETGEILLCVPLTEGLWHDHTGNKNTHLSVGLAGRLHENRPSDPQLEAAARVGAWAVLSSILPSISGIEQIKGHMDYTDTQCPGWDERTGNTGSGFWKPDLYDLIEQELS